MTAPRFEHQWEFICHTPKGELSFCPLCDRWRYGNDRPFKRLSQAKIKTLGPMVFVAKEERP